jgi:hypothetical protein
MTHITFHYQTGLNVLARDKDNSILDRFFTIHKKTVKPYADAYLDRYDAAFLAQRGLKKTSAKGQNSKLLPF